MRKNQQLELNYCMASATFSMSLNLLNRLGMRAKWGTKLRKRDFVLSDKARATRALGGARRNTEHTGPTLLETP